MIKKTKKKPAPAVIMRGIKPKPKPKPKAITPSALEKAIAKLINDFEELNNWCHRLQSQLSYVTREFSGFQDGAIDSIYSKIDKEVNRRVEKHLNIAELNKLYRSALAKLFREYHREKWHTKDWLRKEHGEIVSEIEAMLKQFKDHEQNWEYRCHTLNQSHEKAREVLEKLNEQAANQLDGYIEAKLKPLKTKIAELEAPKPKECEHIYVLLNGQPDMLSCIICKKLIDNPSKT